MLMKKFLYILLLLTISCNSKFDREEIKDESKSSDTEIWDTAEIEYSEEAKKRIDSLNKVYNQKQSLLIIEEGKVIFENYQAPYLKDSLIHINSCTKSVISMLFGMVFRDSLIEHENKSSLSYFPELNIHDSSIYKIKNKHFLAMSSGLDWKGGIDATDVIAMSESKNWAKYVFDRKIKNKPGEQYLYNSGGTQVVSSILHKQVSNNLDGFAVDSLFSPLGIDDFFWEKNDNGVPKAGWGLHLKMEDMAKLGYLMLRNGAWKGKQIIPEYWVKKSTTPQIKISDTWHYGYQFWIPRNSDYKSYLFRGYYPPAHKIIEVIPELDIVAVYVGENSDFHEVIKSYIKVIKEDCTKPHTQQ